ncbi:MAG: hypothetical protein M1833_002898 [Piccolia ochrophora]|nr:MAG: hypothetical protein M1833_002898 [Piccolia ochrophora]
MNTVCPQSSSFGIPLTNCVNLGEVFLGRVGIIAGGGAYYFAKRSINADRADRHAAEMKRRSLQQSLETHEPSRPAGQASSHDFAGSPSQEASRDPAPTRHAPETESQRVREKGKYEASETYRSKKGDRFS